MPIKKYGVWKGTAVRVSAERAEDDSESPHIHLFYEDGKGGKYDGAKRASINVKSLSAISELVFWLIPDFTHPLTDGLPGLEKGFTKIKGEADSLALDYIRGNLMKLEEGRMLPHDLPGEGNDIIDMVMPELQRAINRKADIYLFGEPYSDNQGIHDIHMNQGSAGKFSKYNGLWQDGGVIIAYPDGHFSALFLAFASQAVHTDEKKGNPLPESRNFAELLGYLGSHTDSSTGSNGADHSDVGSSGSENTSPIEDNHPVKIVSALVNPVGPEGQPGFEGRPETVYLANRTSRGISLKGWSLLNRAEEVQSLSGEVWLGPGEICPIAMEIPLSNKGGLITLLDGAGIKVDGVSYTKKQAKTEGELILF
ncbi:MAG: YukJ family protein [Spirochaetales bacterium]|nr:YukJ family protein [Spirochaetales bacterium]